ncbi:heat domain containing protein [Rhodopirellula maiorica SM1]|uniref:Heat domain containing protein n=1 Tax=Rhodopirellula maiorica SM1 TaxID=1265738 RepID=M5RBA9_9BACT|nr:DNA alkylation repair protein [Rhodopirellula maiorica]EMI16670.1 heat domain containing protein [Rhodopirellula maiorica SM1]
MASSRNGTGFSLKDQLFNAERVAYLASCFHAADAQFDATGFVTETMKQLKKLELKERIVHIANTLEHYLASDYTVAAKQITAALPPPLDPTKRDDDFGDFIFAPLGAYVVRNGLDKRHLRLSLKTIKAITQRFSMEDAIRAFINTHPTETLNTLEKWATDRNYHVRRLVSEGTRPRLPWSGRLSIDTTTAIPLLNKLHADPTRYVTRSVSNHLNDIAKTHPDLVLETLKQWQQLGHQDAAELGWMCKHALRTLVKQGNRDALALLGFSPSPKITVTDFAIHTPQVRPGDAIEFTFEITGRKNESLLIDYVIDFVKANGSTSPKVHKIKQVQIKKGETISLKKRHVLRDAATTYSLYPGVHHVTLQINGRSFGTQSFDLQ